MSVTLSLAAFLSAARGASRRTASRAVRSGFGSAGDSPITRAFRRNSIPGPQALRAAADELLREGCAGVTMLVMQLADVVELELVFGRDAADEAVDEAIGRLTRIAAGNGMAVRTAPDTFALLVPDIAPEVLVRTVEVALGRTRCIEFELEGDEIILVPDLMARVVARDESVAQAYDLLCHDLVRIRSSEQRRRDYLRRERESHTRPAPLASARR
jgi:hypothetical protein